MSVCQSTMLWILKCSVWADNSPFPYQLCFGFNAYCQRVHSWELHTGHVKNSPYSISVHKSYSAIEDLLRIYSSCLIFNWIHLTKINYDGQGYASSPLPTPQTAEHLPKALHILPFSGSCIVTTRWPEPDRKIAAILGVILLWQHISSLTCTTSVFQGEAFHDSANMAQFWFPSHCLSLLWTFEHHRQFATTKAGKNREW